MPDFETNAQFEANAQFRAYGEILEEQPDAIAVIQGGSQYPDIRGEVWLYQLKSGVLVAAEVYGLPRQEGQCDSRIFGFHLHDGDSCMNSALIQPRNGNNPFPLSGIHYNPGECEHPHHAGDLPPLFGCNGYAVSIFLTDRFLVADVIGKTMILHDRSDDFKTQPSGDAGEKIACGVIQTVL